jgi:hypothetical protein
MNVSLPAIEFWNLIAKPSIYEFYEDSSNFRKLVIAIWSIDALVEHICWENHDEKMMANERDFLGALLNGNKNYRIIHEASNSLKHAVRNGKGARTKGSMSVEVRSRGWGEAEYATDEWSGPAMGLVKFLDGNSFSLKFAMQNFEQGWIATELGLGSN